MIKIGVWIKENEEVYFKELRYKKPRLYMCGYTFNQLLNYCKNELINEDIKKEDVSTIEIYNKEQHWFVSISKNKE